MNLWSQCECRQLALLWQRRQNGLSQDLPPSLFKLWAVCPSSRGIASLAEGLPLVAQLSPAFGQ